MSSPATRTPAPLFSGAPFCARTVLRVCRFLVVAGLASTPSAYAQSGGFVADRWSFEVTPYFWAAGIKGNVQVGTLPSSAVDVGFSDIWDNLDFAAMGTFEARKDRWGFIFDAVYIKLSASATATRTGPGPVGATLTAAADLKVEETVLTAAAAYRLLEGVTAFDALGGVRYTKVDVTGDIAASLFAQTGVVNRSGDKDWVDPIVGFRVLHRIAERWSLSGYADVGGFGAASDLTWQLAGGVNYELSKTFSAKIGYRVLKVDYDKGGVIYDMKTQGPYAGLSIRF